MDKPDPIPTRASLLRRIADWDDQTSWREFHATYHRLIFKFARQQGLSEAEAQDVVQETLLAVAKGIRSFDYEPARSSFKNWLLTVTRHRIADHFRKRRHPLVEKPERESDSNQTSTVDRIADPAMWAADAAWDAEWQQNVTDLALERLKQRVTPRHFQIFYLSVIKQQPAVVVAKALGTNRGNVYLVRHRVLPLFKQAVASVELEAGGMQ